MIKIVRTYPPISDTTYFLDTKDIFRQYDLELWKLLTVPLSMFGVNFSKIWGWDELNNLQVDKLREIALSLNVYSDTDNKDLLIKSIFNGQRIPVVFASPDPAYAIQPLTTGRKETSKVSNTVRFPIITMTRLSTSEDHERYYPGIVRKIAWSSDKNSVIQGQKPLPLIYRWQVEVLTKLRTHINLITQHIFRTFKTTPLQIKLDHGEPWNELTVHYDSEESYDDQSEYESDAENAQRIIRQIHNISCYGWLPLFTYATPTIRTYTREFVDYDQMFLDSQTITLDGGT